MSEQAFETERTRVSEDEVQIHSMEIQSTEWTQPAESTQPTGASATEISKVNNNLPCSPELPRPVGSNDILPQQCIHGSGTGCRCCFTLFGKLPPELRQLVFSYMEDVLHPPRWLFMAPKYENEKTQITLWTISGGSCNHWSLNAGFRPPITTMALSSEARTIALRTNVAWSSICCSSFTPSYINLRPFFPGPLRGHYWRARELYIDPRNDVFFFSLPSVPNNSDPFDIYGMNDAAAHVSSATEAKGFKMIRHLAIPFPTLYEASLQQRKTFLQYLSCYSMIEDLTVVVPLEREPTFHCSFAVFDNAQTPYTVKAANLFQRYVEGFLGENTNSRIPVVKVVFYSNFSRQWFNESSACNRAYLDKAFLRGDGGKNPNEIWDAVIQKEWKDILQKLESDEASLTRIAISRGLGRGQH